MKLTQNDNEYDPGCEGVGKGFIVIQSLKPHSSSLLNEQLTPEQIDKTLSVFFTTTFHYQFQGRQITKECIKSDSAGSKRKIFNTLLRKSEEFRGAIINALNKGEESDQLETVV